MSSSTQIQFLGGAGTVTGSKMLVRHEAHRLLVDCGLFQGLKALRLQNWEPLPVAPETLDAVVLTHAHLDHSGFLPRLVRLGYQGPVYCSDGTRDLCNLLLPDSGRLQEEQADYANRHGTSKHHPALPLYTEAQAREALKLLRPIHFDEPFQPWRGITLKLRRAGHIVGASSVHLSAGGNSLLFSGDLGRDDDLVMKPPEPPLASDVVVLESTYGDRNHAAVDPLDAIADAIARTAARGGIVVIPAFAVGRAQALLHAIHRLKKARRIPDLPVYLNSPMAADALRLLKMHTPDHRLRAADCDELAGEVTVVDTVEESKRLNQLSYPSVIVSASGMATGGRVLHHLKAYLPNPRHTVLFAGYQAAGTRGATLVGGAKTVKIFGEQIPVRAEVASIDGFSAHADQAQLLAWLGKLPFGPRKVLLNHGEPAASDMLRQEIQERFGWNVEVASPGQTVDI